MLQTGSLTPPASRHDSLFVRSRIRILAMLIGAAVALIWAGTGAVLGRLQREREGEADGTLVGNRVA